MALLNYSGMRCAIIWKIILQESLNKNEKFINAKIYKMRFPVIYWPAVSEKVFLNH
jgi:hypothetical protein